MSLPPKNTFRFVTESDDVWRVFVDNDCARVYEAYLADILKPLSENPGWFFYVQFGMNGIEEALAAFKKERANVA